MASIVSKVARAALANFASQSAVGGIAGGGRPLSRCLPRLYQTGADIRVSSAGGPKPEEEKTSPKSEAAPHAAIMHPEPPFPKVDKKVLESDEAMWAFYEYWCKYHGISRDRCEMECRFKIFSKNAGRVYEFNNSCVGGKMGMTKFVDMTKEERSRLRGYRRATK